MSELNKENINKGVIYNLINSFNMSDGSGFFNYYYNLF
jgi:hypothetical protein